VSPEWPNRSAEHTGVALEVTVESVMTKTLSGGLPADIVSDAAGWSSVLLVISDAFSM